MLRKRFASYCLFILLVLGGDAWAVNLRDADFLCGGRVESEVWQLWDTSARGYLSTQQLSNRLQEQGDVYALYDIQTYTHNLVDMARRCKRIDRMKELGDFFGLAYSFLESAPEGKTGFAWVCKGGAICNEKNRLINREVMLVSLQFLSLTASVANSLSFSYSHPRSEFVVRTAIASIEHLQRYADSEEMSMLDKRLAAQAQDVTNESSALFFTDKPLWMIAIYADMAGILQSNPSLSSDAKLSKNQLQAMRAHLIKLLKLFGARITIKDVIGRDGRAVKLAELDRGFWRLFADNRYAGYAGIKKPVTCIHQPDGSFQIITSVDAASLRPVSDLGWDISHARRLVHAFDAMERNRVALQKVFGITAADLPSDKTMHAFAQQLTVNVWNGDADYPLFSNYWSGANGWYRVAYDNGTSRCMEGYPPFGLSDSFATGGYASWGRYAPEIRPLGRRLYRLSVSDEEAASLFIDKYYPGLGDQESAGNRMLTQLMFWPTLVEVRQ